jgi:two-component system NtrC family sensor kinase
MPDRHASQGVSLTSDDATPEEKTASEAAGTDRRRLDRDGRGDPEDRSLSDRPTLSIRAKIVLSFALFFALCVAVSLWSIWVITNLEDRIQFLEVAGNLMMEVQQARRYEKNFLLYGANFEDARFHLTNAESTLDRHSATISKVLGESRFRTMEVYISDYHDRLNRLAVAQDEALKRSIVPQLRRDGAKMVSFAEEFVRTEREMVEHRLLLAKRVPFFFLAGLLVLMLTVASWLTRNLLITLKRFMVHTERISMGDFSPITPVRKYKDEFSKLAQAFNRMTRELERRQEILVESHKLRAIGTLVAGVAHELNNPLNNTMLSAAVLKEDLSTLTDEEKIEILDDVISETERSQRIVRNLLDFARASEATITPLDVQRIVSESVSLVANQVRMAKIKLETEFDPDLPHVHGDEQMLKQVFVNLVLNAVDELPPGGLIRIGVRKHQEDGYLTVEVQDNGPGIPEHIRSRIFEPFFTTKGREKGTGLGLSVSQGIVHKLGGFIRLKRRAGEGTTFVVSLPITDSPSDVMSHDMPASDPVAGGVSDPPDRPGREP